MSDLADIAKTRGVDAIDALLDILVEDEGFTQCAVFAMSEPDILLALQQPWTSVDNDSQGTAPDGRLGKEHPHPRAYGTFPRVLGHYVRDAHVLTLEQAVHKMTGMPAARLGLIDRGVLREGSAADLVVFDPRTIADRATFDAPHRYAAGIDYVLVNGVTAVENGKFTDSRAGRVLRRTGGRK